MITRRTFLKGAGATGLALTAAQRLDFARALAETAAAGLSDPAAQPKFVNAVPDAMAPGFKYQAVNSQGTKYRVAVGPTVQQTGLVDGNGVLLDTPLFGYGNQNDGFTWPGKTFEVQKGEPIEVLWRNQLRDPVTWQVLDHLLPVDTSLHWAYSLHGYTQHSIAADGVPIVPHLHGGHTISFFDGNPEYFFSPGFKVKGPRWVSKKYYYLNDQPAGTLWYHDHALGITRLNVYAGMAGFYILRDEVRHRPARQPAGAARPSV